MSAAAPHPVVPRVVAAFVLTLLLPAFLRAETPPPYPCEPDQIEVMFDRDATVRLRGISLVDLSDTNALAGVDQSLAWTARKEWVRICETPESEIDALTAGGEARTGKRLYNPNNMYRLWIDPAADVWAVSRELEALPGVHRARPVPKPMAPPTPPDYQYLQGYLDPAANTPTGIDAQYAWTRPGGTGTGITICDLEYSWNLLHADNQWSHEIHVYTQDPQNDDNHGTAVLGVMGSINNGWGTTGISHGSTFWTCGTYFKPLGQPNYSWNVPGSIVDAASAMSPGDVMIIEHQWDLTGANGFVPIEWWQDTPPNQSYNGVYSSIEWALATRRVHVIEPAGNGNYDLDNLNWYGDSGAIIVGAGGAYPGGTWPGGDLERLSFSSYGSRVDVQGWGEDVCTTGYGYLYNSEGPNYYYTNSFDGTSSASPVVAGAVASCAGFWDANISARFPMHPAHVRNVLKATGTPQITPPAGHIGPRPDLRAAFVALDDWIDVTASPLDDTGGFASWGDYDNDGDPDIYLIHSPYVPNKLLRNDGAAGFTDVTPSIMSDLNGYGGGAVWGDYDNDGDLDLYLANAGGSYNKLFRNEGGGSFVDATSGVLGSPILGSGPTWIDYDNDGDIDLYVAKYVGANKLLRNEGGGTFIDVTSGPEGDTGATTQAAWADYDHDGDQDVYILTHNAQNRLLRNDAGTFTDVTAPGLAIQDGGTATWGDYDNDGDLDLYVSIPTWGTPNKLFRNDGGGTLTDVTTSPIDDTQHCGMTGWVDADNDGDLDLYLVNNDERNRLFVNESGSFTDNTHGLLIWEGYSSGFSWADYDSDGDLDSYFGINFPSGSNTLVENNSTGTNHWLQVQLVGRTSNACGIGARVQAVTGRGTQIREVKANPLEHSLIVTFGLGSADVVQSLRIEWPGGAEQETTSVAADQRLVIWERTSSGVDGPTAPPLVTQLYPGAPNPFNERTGTVIRYDLRNDCPVELRVHDISGRVVRVLENGAVREAGRYPVAWDGRDEHGRPLASGAYFCRFEADGKRQHQTLIILR